MKKKGESSSLGSKQDSKNVWLLGSSSFFNDAGSEMIAPILPFYLTSLGANGAVLGLVSGLREGLSSLFKIFGGWYSDKVGHRKFFVFFGYFLSIIFRFLIAIATTWHQVLGFVSLERFGKLRDAPRDVIISANSKKKGKNFGIQQAMDTLGAILGTIIILFLFWKLDLEFKTIIIIAASISVLSLIPIFFVKDPKIKKINQGLFKSVSELSPKLKYFIFVAAVFTLGNFGIYMFLLLIAQEMTGSIVFPLVSYIIFNISYAFFAIPFGNLSDKIGRKKILIFGYVLFFGVVIGFVFLQNLVQLTLLFFFYGLVYAVVQPNQKALVADLSEKEKGTALGFYYMVIGLVSIPAGFIGGLLWDVSQKLMFEYLAVVALVSIVLLMFVKK